MHKVAVRPRRSREFAEAVLAAYGWPADISDAEIVSRLLALNLEREPA